MIALAEEIGKEGIFKAICPMKKMSSGFDGKEEYTSGENTKASEKADSDGPYDEEWKAFN